MHDHTYYLRLASQHYLTDEIPANWDDLSLPDQSQFIYDHMWEPFMGVSADELFEHIDDLANAFKQVAHNERIATLSEVHERLESSCASLNQTKTEDQ